MKGPGVKKCEQPLDAGKDKEMDSPLNPPEEMQPADTLIFTSNQHDVIEAGGQCAIWWKGMAQIP